MGKTIAVLFHEKRSINSLRNYTITYLADFWREDGHKVVFLFGTKQFISADICIVHVDLSVVPEEYLAFASQYPITINGKISDISKKSFSNNIVRQDDQYLGQVIVKSNLNYAGRPEKILLGNPISRLLSRSDIKFNFLSRYFKSPQDYKIYEHASDVPSVYYQDPYYIVEKFLPEKKEDIYYVNLFYFFGDCYQCLKLGAKNPIVNGQVPGSCEAASPHPDIYKIREGMSYDYGKFDYCVNNGKVILLDANKTVGVGGIRYVKQLTKVYRQRADALYSYFD